MIPIITIDGPVSSGKGTVARLVAARLAWHLLDSGALYRVLGLYATRQGVALDDQPALIRLAENLPVVFREQNGDTAVVLDGEDVSACLLYTLRAHETVLDLVCRLLLEKKKKKNINYLN